MHYPPKMSSSTLKRLSALRSMDYDDVNEVLGQRSKKEIAGNTWLERNPDRTIAVRYHETQIAIWRPDGHVEFHMKGFNTKTTRERLNLLGMPVSTERHVPYHSIHGKRKFIDGDTRFRGRRDLHTVDYDRLQADPQSLSKSKRLVAQISDYARLCANSLPLEMPGNGDCIPCRANSQSVGHLYSHMDEGYVVPTLVYSALIEANEKTQDVFLCFEPKLIDVYRRYFEQKVYSAVKKYLLRRLAP